MRIGNMASNIIVAIYILGTLYLRFEIEDQLQGQLLISLGIGAFCILFLWALIKTKVLNPSALGYGIEDR